MVINILNIADSLSGTCKRLDEFVDPDTLTQEQCEELDSLVRLCEVCGWWELTDDMYNDYVCDSCKDD